MALILIAIPALFAKKCPKCYTIMDFNMANLSHGQYQAASTFHQFVLRIFEFFIEGLSCVLQVALLVVVCILANHLWTQDLQVLYN